MHTLFMKRLGLCSEYTAKPKLMGFIYFYSIGLV